MKLFGILLWWWLHKRTHVIKLSGINYICNKIQVKLEKSE